jgi:ribonuclease-3 family protein
MEQIEELLRAAGHGLADGYSPLGLAWLGDAVFELLVRAKTASGGNLPVNELSLAARGYSNAAAQSAFYSVLEPHLTEEEAAVLKRGRNAKSYTRAKNAGIMDYRRATGVESLFGYLLLKGRTARLMGLFSAIDTNTND